MLFILFTRRHVITVSTWSRDYNSLLSVSRMAAFRHDAHKHTHTDTCAHTQVSTLPPATELGLRISAQLRTLKLYKTHFQALMNPAIFSYRTGLRMATTDVETERTYRMSAPKIQK